MSTRKYEPAHTLLDAESRGRFLKNWWDAVGRSIDPFIVRENEFEPTAESLHFSICEECRSLTLDRGSLPPIQLVQHVLTAHPELTAIFSPTVNVLNFIDVNENISDETYFPYFSDIALRARNLLNGKSDDNICFCSFISRIRIDKVFLNIDHALAMKGDDYYDCRESSFSIGDRVGLEQVFEDSRADHANCPTVVWVLPNVDASEVPEIEFFEHEVLAVLAITKLVNSMWAFDAPLEFLITETAPLDELTRYFESFSDVPEGERSALIYQQNLIIAGKFAMEAVAAVTWAEMKKKEYDKKNSDLDRKVEVLRVMQDSRHKNNRQVQAMVLEEWDRLRVDKAYVLNAERNGIALANWLGGQDVQRSPRVVSEWLRAYAKDQGIRWR